MKSVIHRRDLLFCIKNRVPCTDNYKLRCIFEKMEISKKHQISMILWKKDTTSIKFINKLVSKCTCWLFRVSLIKHSLKTIVTDGHFIFYHNQFYLQQLKQIRLYRIEFYKDPEVSLALPSRKSNFVIDPVTTMHFQAF